MEAQQKDVHADPIDVQQQKDAYERAVPKEKLETSNRAQRRKQFGIRHGSGGMLSRFRSGVATGRTSHFSLWMADLNMKRSLQTINVSRLAGATKEPQLVAAYEILAGAGYRNVYALTRATREELLALKGFGPKRLEAVKADFARNKVRVNW